MLVFPMLAAIATMIWGVKLAYETAEDFDWQNDVQVFAYGILLMLIFLMEFFCIVVLVMFWSMW